MLGGLGPDERSGALVVALDEVLDRRDQFGNVVLDPAANLLLGQDREPDRDHVQPGRARRREVEMDPRVTSQPRFDLGCAATRRRSSEDRLRCFLRPARKMGSQWPRSTGFSVGARRAAIGRDESALVTAAVRAQAVMYRRSQHRIPARARGRCRSGSSPTTWLPPKLRIFVRANA
jgi:hypothetical protein